MAFTGGVDPSRLRSRAGRGSAWLGKSHEEC